MKTTRAFTQELKTDEYLVKPRCWQKCVFTPVFFFFFFFLIYYFVLWAKKPGSAPEGEGVGADAPFTKGVGLSSPFLFL